MPEKIYRLILGSASPRRKELLGHLGIPFTVKTADLDEVSNLVESTAIVQDLALQKGKAVFESLGRDEDVLIISSDTIVCVDQEILNKPANEAEARQMLLKLSNRTHTVKTAVAFTTAQKVHAFVVTSDVTFDDITEDLMQIYLKTGDSLDKAGAYGIQGPSLTFISAVNGSYSAVVGFPLSHIVKELKVFLGVSDLRQSFKA